MRVKLLGADALVHDSEPIPAITKVSALVVENVKEQPSTGLQSLNSWLGMLGLVSKGAVVFAPFTLYPIMSHAASELLVVPVIVTVPDTGATA
jgi:uncharacterized membrane protein (DUF2068 family)